MDPMQTGLIAVGIVLCIVGFVVLADGYSDYSNAKNELRSLEDGASKTYFNAHEKRDAGMSFIFAGFFCIAPIGVPLLLVGIFGYFKNRQDKLLIRQIGMSICVALIISTVTGILVYQQGERELDEMSNEQPYWEGVKGDYYDAHEQREWGLILIGFSLMVILPVGGSFLVIGSVYNPNSPIQLPKDGNRPKHRRTNLNPRP